MICDNCGKSNQITVSQCEYCASDMSKTSDTNGFADFFSITSTPHISFGETCSQKLNSIFAVEEEKVPHCGEDSFYYDSSDDTFIISTLDGCGGSGAKKYSNYYNKTGAYIASKAVCGSIQAWFRESLSGNKFRDYVTDALKICMKYEDNSSRLSGSIIKSFPTTVATLTGKFTENHIDLTCYWAGDSRCYMLDSDGLHQLTEDDLKVQDAMINLTDDGVLTNIVNATTAFEIHQKSVSVSSPCILFTATDGCFGYLNSPMEFEYIIVDTMQKSENPAEWKNSLNKRISEITGDDYALCMAVCGFEDFKDIQDCFLKRHNLLYKKYIKTSSDLLKLWKAYKKGYYSYL